MFKLNNKGFSLIELMIVVAIIGILASVAVPNFQKFMAKSKQGEAKSNLSALYTAEKTFFGEWNSYFSDFRDIGFSPEGELRYNVGFNAAGAVTLPANYPIVAGNSSAGPNNTAAATEINTGVFCVPNGTAVAPGNGGSLSPAGDNCRQLFNPATGANPALGPAATVVTATTFIAGAAGDLDGDATEDVWTINQSKVVSNLIPDLQD